VCGKDWLSNNDVPVCSPGTNANCAGQPHIGSTSKDPANPNWQCVELAQRLYKTKGWYTGTSTGVFASVQIADDIYQYAQSLGFVSTLNGSISSVRPGDMIIHKKSEPGTNSSGHVAIVDTVQGGTITAREQNRSKNGTATHSLSGGFLTRTGPDASASSNIEGLVHSPANS